MTRVEAPQSCLYEILGIQQNATTEEIRSAYRKLALKLHPDKAVQSGISKEQATTRFQEILGAYNVLSDPAMRSWYNSHRSEMPNSFTSSSYPKNWDFDINLEPYFSTSVYSGYGDTGKGFFRVYADIFQTLFQHEIAYAHSMGAGPVHVAPLIGNLESSYAQVSAFYNYWLAFSTLKDFSWVDKYRDSANRKARRLQEEENKKLRKAAQRKYNGSVRQLAEFVKKRDKRVLERELHKKKVKAAKETLRAEKLEKEKPVRQTQSDRNAGNHDGWYDYCRWYNVDVTGDDEEVEADRNRGTNEGFFDDGGWNNVDVKGRNGREHGEFSYEGLFDDGGWYNVDVKGRKGPEHGEGIYEELFDNGGWYNVDVKRRTGCEHGQLSGIYGFCFAGCGNKFNYMQWNKR